MNLAGINFGMSAPGAPASLQVPDELEAFIAFARRHKVRRYLEVGARYGGTFRAMMQSLPEATLGVAVDLPGGAFGHDASSEALDEVMGGLRQQGRRVRAILGSSRDAGVVRLVESHVTREGLFDLVLIDGDHSYAAVAEDFAIYSRLARIVAMHDIAAPEGWCSKKGDLVEVPRFWTEVRNRFPSEAIVSEGSKMGIGILHCRPASN